MRSTKHEARSTIMPRGAKSPADFHRLERRSLRLYSCIYVCTGVTFVTAAFVLIHLNRKFSSAAAALEKQIEMVVEQQILTQQLRAIGAEYWHPDPDATYVDQRQRRSELDQRRIETMDQFKTLMARLLMLAEPAQGSEILDSGVRRALSQLSSSWAQARYELGMLGESPQVIGFQGVKDACDGLLRDCSALRQRLKKSQGDTQTSRSWLVGIQIFGLIGLGLLMMWFLWSGTNSRMEIVALNTMLESRVAQRTTQLEKANLYLANVQSSIGSALVVVDPDDRVVFLNTAAEEMWGVRRMQAERRDIFNLQPISQNPDFCAALVRVQKREEERATVGEFHWVDRDGRPRYGRASIVLMKDAQSKPMGVVILVDEVSELVHAREELALRATEIERTNDVLKRVNNDLEQFVYAASHDLRLPLVNLAGLRAKIQNACDGLRSLWCGDSPQQANAGSAGEVLEHQLPRFLAHMNASITKLGSIIDGLLRYSRTGREVYAMTDVDMQLEVAKVFELMAPTVEEKDVHVFIADLPAARGDAGAVGQVLANLMANALNYLDPNRPGEIFMEGEFLENGMCRYAVRDNGVGITEDNLERVFRIFERLDPDRCRGEGLGLAIVKKIVEGHGGQVGVESRWGEGTTFWFTLPAGPQVAAAHVL